MWLSCIAFLFAGCVAAQNVEAATKGYPYRYSNVAITGGGFLTGFVAHPTAKDLIYVRTDIGSTYQWNAANNIWTPLTDFISAAEFNYFGTESIALDPTNPDMLYLAQGQYFGNPAAFFVSHNRGANFSIYPSPVEMGSNNLGRNNGERLAVNPFNTKQLYFGSRTEGLWVSNDRAKTWANVTNFPNTASAAGIGLVFVLFDPNHSGTIYVGANTPGGLYYTKNNGATWASVPGQPTTWNGTTIYPSSPPQSSGPLPMRGLLGNNGVLYVTFADSPGPYGVNYGNVHKYDTKNSTWTEITPGRNGNSYPPPLTSTGPSGGFCALSILPSDPDYVVTNTLNHYNGGSDSVFLSRDGGVTWKDVAQLSSPQYAYGSWSHPWQEAALKNGTSVNWLTWNWSGGPNPNVGQVSFGWWLAAVLINPTNPDQIMYGTGATIWATDDVTRVDRNQAPTWYVNAQGIEETANLALISPSSGANLLSAFGDICGFRHDSLQVPPAMFGAPVFSNGNDLDWAGAEPNVIVRVGSANGASGVGCGLGAYSTDGGQGWFRFGSCANGADSSSYTGGYITVDAGGTDMVWTTQSAGPYYSSDYGATWNTPGGLTTYTGNIASDKVHASTFYAFTAGTFYLSTNGGASFTSFDSSITGLPAGSGARPVASILNAGEVWLPIAYSGLYHSVDYGTTWTKIGGKNGAINPRHFSIGKNAPGHPNKPALYLWGTVTSGSVDGLYRSDDGGSTWMRINDDEHQYGGPSQIQGDSRVFGRCYFGMNGRGIVYADIDGEATGTGVRPGTYGI